MDNRDTTQGGLSPQAQRGLSRPTGRYNPLHEMQEQMRRMDALFNRMFGFDPMFSPWRSELQQMSQMQPYEPEVDIYENDTEYIIRAALPGIEPQDIQLEVTDDSVTLSAQRRNPFDRAREETAEAQPQASAQTGPQQQPPSVAGEAQTGVNAGQPSTGSGSQAGNRSQTDSDPSHIQHRRSRYTSQTRIRLAYTLPGPIDPDSARASFQHGMLELHLPKQRQTNARTVPISVGSGAATPSIGPNTGTGSGQTPGTGQTQGPGQAAMQEGRPSQKMGSNYTPTAGEDHAAQAQSIAARTEHEPGRQENPIAAGQTNPMGSAAPSGTGTPTETQRP